MINELININDIINYLINSIMELREILTLSTVIVSCSVIMYIIVLTIILANITVKKGVKGDTGNSGPMGQATTCHEAKREQCR